MGDGDGVYYSDSAYSGSAGPAPAPDRRRPGAAARRAKKAAVAIVGLGAVGGGAYFGTTLLTGDAPGYVSGGPVARAPFAPPTSATTTAAPRLPSPEPQVGIKSGVRQSALASPTPSELALSDDEVAAAQVSRLLQASPQPSAGEMGIQSAPVTVSSQAGTDGSAIRVVAAHFDLAGWWTAADRGRAVGDARCTRRLQAGPDPAPRLRPTMLMCWRTGPGKSVVTVAVNPRRKPMDAVSVDVLDREWDSLG